MANLGNGRWNGSESFCIDTKESFKEFREDKLIEYEIILPPAQMNESNFLKFYLLKSIKNENLDDKL